MSNDLYAGLLYVFGVACLAFLAGCVYLPAVAGVIGVAALFVAYHLEDTGGDA
jgi:hypothetical protein